MRPYSSFVFMCTAELLRTLRFPTCSTLPIFYSLALSSAPRSLGPDLTTRISVKLFCIACSILTAFAAPSSRNASSIMTGIAAVHLFFSLTQACSKQSFDS